MPLTEVERIAAHRNKVDSAFYVLGENTPLGTPESNNIGIRGQFLSRYRNETRTNRQKTKSALGELFSLLDVDTYRGRKGKAGILQLMHDPERLAETKARAYAHLAEAYGIPDIENELSQYGGIANEIIQEDLNVDILQQSESGSQFELSDEILTNDDPVDLAIMLFDRNLSRRQRFEAKRKLILMELTAQVAKRMRESDIEEKSAKFKQILQKHVWSKGDFDRVVRLSTHDPETLECTDVQIITDPADFAKVKAGYGQKKEVIDRRRFNSINFEIPAFVRPRELKDIKTQVLKLLYRGEKDPEAAIHDLIGLMVVFDKLEDIDKFKKSLRRAAMEYGSFMKIDDEEDKFEDERIIDKRPGSSEKYKDHNFIVTVGGVKVEIMLHTHKSYLDSVHDYRVAHKKYAIQRAFESGVVKRLFPPDIFHYDPDELQEYAIQSVRQDLGKGINLRQAA